MIASQAARLEAAGRAAELTPAIGKAMEEAAQRALLPRFRNLAEQDCLEKSAGEMVTVADRECEAILHDRLAALLPGASIVGEESAHLHPELLAGLGDDLCWIIDPLDGTGYFAAGQEPFGIMVALACDGVAVGGWIFDPLSGRSCWTAAGHGAWVNNRRISIQTMEPARASFGLSSLLKRRRERFQSLVTRLNSSFAPCDIPRCAAAHYPAMLSGGPELTLFERTLPWDHAAGALLIEEAGGKVARLDGSPYRVDDERVGLLAAVHPALWDRAAALLQDFPE